MTTHVHALAARLAASAGSLSRLRDFRSFWIANIVSNLGSSAFLMALSWLTVRSYGASGIAALALGYGFPQFLLEVVGGAEADRINRRHLFQLTEAGFLVVALVLWLASLSGAVPLWLLVSLTACNGAISAFDSPARTALISELVPVEELVDAEQLYSVSSNITNIFGPALGGILMSIGSSDRSHEEIVFLFNVFSFLPLLALIPFLPPGFSSVRAGKKQSASFVRSVSEGLRFVRADKRLRPLLMLLAVVMLLGMPFQTLLPIFVDGHHSMAGAQNHGAYAVLLSTVGSGGFVGSLFGMAAGEGSQPGRALLIAASGLGLSIVLLASSNSLLLASLASFMAGACGILALNLDMALVEGLTPLALQGRVSAIASLGKGLQSFSAAGASAMIHWVATFGNLRSIGYTVVQCSMALMLIVAVIALRPALLRLSLNPGHL